MSYLALDRVFTGNMTGNVLFIGFALLGVAQIPLLNNLCALAGFVVGSIIGARVVGPIVEDGFGRRSVAVLASGGVLIIGIAIACTVIPTLSTPIEVVLTFLLACVMGAQATAVRPAGYTDVTTIVATSTLGNLARDSRMAGGRGQPWFPRLSAILALVTGAAVGAAGVQILNGPAALSIGVVFYLAGVAVLVGSFTERDSAGRLSLVRTPQSAQIAPGAPRS